MFRKVYIISLVFTCFVACIFSHVTAQNKYALLIAGPTSIEGDFGEIDPNSLWAGLNGGELNEFWNDTYLLYNLLTKEFDFSEENVFCLYNGYDPEPGYPPAYYPFDGYSFSDGAASGSNIVTTLQTLQNIMTENDFLFVWVFSHGYSEAGEGYFYIANSVKMTASTFAALLNPVPGKKVIWMQQCSGGSFNIPLMQDHVVFTSAAQPQGFAYRADNRQVVESTLVELYENTEMETYYLYPYACNHGEFNFHMYSSTRGLTPTGLPIYGDFNPIPLSSVDLNNDNVISVHESALWEAAQQSRFGYPDYESPLYDEGLPGLGGKTSLKYPNIVNTLSDLSLDEENIGYYGITSDLVVSNGQRLAFGANSKIHLLNNAKIRIQGNAILEVGNGVEFFGNEDNFIAIDQGHLELGQNVQFSHREPNHIFGGLQMNGFASAGTLTKARFLGAQLQNASSSLALSQCSFDSTSTEDGNIAVYSTAGNVMISECAFDDASIFLSNPDPRQNPDWLAYLHHNDIHHGSINLQGYRNYKVEFNQISHADLYAISLEYVGNGGSSNQSISQNNLSNSAYGIFLFNAQARIYCNNIHNTVRGIYFGNYSSSAVLGFTGLHQSIVNCEMEELYIDHGCFPTALKYNSIVDDDNFGGQFDPLLRYQGAPNEFESYDITLNCWGSGFNPNQDITVMGEDAEVCFSIYPLWCPGNPTPIDPPTDLFNSAIALVDSGSYLQAKSLFKWIVEQYPNSLQAEASLKELFQIEIFADNDYPGLQEYFMTNDSIIADSILSKTGEYLAVRCNEMFENWPDEISWFEERIMNPESESDSLYAIMDLAHTYLLMENSSSKSTYTGFLSQFKPVSLKKYIPYRDTLVALLPGPKTNLEKRLSYLGGGKLLQNIPNPASEQTTVFFRLDKEANIDILVASMHDRVVKTYSESRCMNGLHHTIINLTDLAPGFYTIRLLINGVYSDMKKLIKY